MTTALERVVRQAGTVRATENCDMCGEALPETHRHLIDSDKTEVQCVCRACGVLFDRAVASNGHYRLIPRRRVRTSAVDTTRLGVPVGLAFFVPRSDGRVLAHYPSPLGSTDWEVDESAWADLATQHPQLSDLQPDVQALLVNTAWGAREFWIVPVEDCFRLVAIIRREWKGLSGGGTVWPAVTMYFAELTERED